MSSNDEIKIFYLLSVKLVDQVPMLERHRKQATEWLKQWTPKNNFKAVITADMNAAISAFRDDFKKTCATHGYPPANFEFMIGMTEIETTDDGIRRFWHNASSAARIVASDVNALGDL